MKDLSFISVMVVVVCMSGCQEKESVKIQDTSPSVTFERRQKADISYTTGEKDEFHTKSLVESSRKNVLTNFGTWKDNLTIDTSEQPALEKALKRPNSPVASVMSFTNRPINLPTYPFDFENNVTALKELYADHKLDMVISSKMTELEKMSALMVFTNQFFEGGRLPTAEEKREKSSPSANVLTKLRREEGIGGGSEEHAAFFCQIALAAGYNARIIGMHTFDSNGTVFRHEVVEVFLNILDKWVVCDPYSRATYYLRNDVPLSALEVRQLMLENLYKEIIPMSAIGDFADVVSVRENLLERYQFI
ncbi:hypothetical protein ACFL47_05525 [Candidatus Latescibacterota bacterium]